MGCIGNVPAACNGTGQALLWDLVVSEVRLLLLQGYTVKRSCSICDQRAATKLTYGDIAAAESPAFWCTQCYDMLHYTSDGECLDVDHKVFPYGSG